MNRKLSLLTLLALPALFPAAATFSLTSPSGAINASIGNDLEYCISVNTHKLLSGSASLTIGENKTIDRITKGEKHNIDRRIASPFYRSDSVTEKYNELCLKAGKDWKVRFRAYDDGVAYRWEYTGTKPLNIVDEEIRYSFPGDALARVPFVRTDNIKDFESQFFNSFENVYTVDSISRLDSRRLAFLPMAVEATPDARILFTESDVVNYPGLYLNHDEGTSFRGVFAPRPRHLRQGGYLNAQMLVDERENYIAEVDGPRTFPWRLIMIAPDDKSLAQSDLGYLLGADPQIEDTSWIKPGKVAWDWWNDWNITGVDFETGVNNDTYKAYIDFASENGVEYVILDDGWSSKETGDLFTVVPEINLEELVEYGNKKGVGLILWAGYLPFAKEMEKVCRHYSEMGIKGFKVDFLDRNDQLMTDFENKAAELAAKYHLVLDLHGTHMPGSLNRRWPNVLNFEGVHGMEQMKWNPVEIDQMEYDTSIPFLRQASGPMDYTQGAMRNAVRSNYYPCNSEPMSQGTRCHQLALYMILDAPLTMLCDAPSSYRKEPECTSFICGIPTVWDETIVLDGKMGDYIVTARRKGSDWYIGGITDWTPREITLDLAPLKLGAEADICLFYDGKNAHRNAADYSKKHLTYPDNKSIIIKMAPGGGFAAKITSK